MTPTDDGLTLTTPRRIRDGHACGIVIEGSGTKGLLEGCDISGNAEASVDISAGADPIVASCKCVPLGLWKGGGLFLPLWKGGLHPPTFRNGATGPLLSHCGLMTDDGRSVGTVGSLVASSDRPFLDGAIGKPARPAMMDD